MQLGKAVHPTPDGLFIFVTFIFFSFLKKLFDIIHPVFALFSNKTFFYSQIVEYILLFDLSDSKYLL